MRCLLLFFFVITEATKINPSFWYLLRENPAYRNTAHILTALLFSVYTDLIRCRVCRACRVCRVSSLCPCAELMSPSVVLLRSLLVKLHEATNACVFEVLYMFFKGTLRPSNANVANEWRTPASSRQNGFLLESVRFPSAIVRIITTLESSFSAVCCNVCIHISWVNNGNKWDVWYVCEFVVF